MIELNGTTQVILLKEKVKCRAVPIVCHHSCAVSYYIVDSAVCVDGVWGRLSWLRETAQLR